MIDSEQRVEAMVANGMKIMGDAIEEYKPVAIAAAFSSGDDSIVTTHFTMENFADAFVFNADTMVGLAPSRCHLREVCEKNCWQLEIGQAVAMGPPKRMKQNGKLVPFDVTKQLPAGKWVDGTTAYEEYCLNFGFPGRAKIQHSQMYRRLKERPIRRMLKRFGATKAKAKVLLISGIRHDESSIRAGYKKATFEGYFGDVWVNPFYFSTAFDFECYRQEFGLPRNPSKKLCGISGECCCGTFNAVNEREAYKVADPAFEAYLTDLEKRVQANGFPWGWGESPPQWWKDMRSGQQFIDFGADAPTFQPMCVGCNSGRR